MGAAIRHRVLPGRRRPGAGRRRMEPPLGGISPRPGGWPGGVPVPELVRARGPGARQEGALVSREAMVLAEGLDRGALREALGTALGSIEEAIALLEELSAEVARVGGPPLGTAGK